MATFPKFILLLGLVHLASALPLNVLQSRHNIVDPITCEIADLQITNPEAALNQLAAGTLRPPNGLDVEEFAGLLQSCDAQFKARSNLAQQSRVASPTSASSTSGNGHPVGNCGNGSCHGHPTPPRPDDATADPNAASNIAATTAAPATAAPADASTSINTDSSATDNNSPSSDSDTSANTNNANRLINPLPVNPDEPADPPSDNAPASPPSESNNNAVPADAPTNDTPAADPPAPATPSSANSNVANANSNANSRTGSPFQAFDPNAAPPSGVPQPNRNRFGGSAAARTGAGRGDAGGFGLSALGLNSIGGVGTDNLMSTVDSLTGATGNLGAITNLASPLSLIGGGGLPVPGVPNLPTGAVPSVPGVPNLPTGAVPGLKTFEQFVPADGAIDGMEDSAAGGATNQVNSAARCENGDVTVCSDTTTGV